MPVLNAQHQFIYSVASQRFLSIDNIHRLEMFMNLKTTLSRSFLALYNEYTVKIISALRRFSQYLRLKCLLYIWKKALSSSLTISSV